MKKLKMMIAPLLMLAAFGCASVPAYAATAEPPAAAGNGPYFLGAGIAVLVLIGVAVFCKFKGNR